MILLVFMVFFKNKLISNIRDFLWRLNTEWKKICQPVRAESAFQHYCAQCAVFPSPTLAASGSTETQNGHLVCCAQPHRALRGCFYPAGLLYCGSTTSLKVFPMCIILTRTFMLNGPIKILSYMKQKNNLHYSPKAGSYLWVCYTNEGFSLFTVRLGFIDIPLLTDFLVTNNDCVIRNGISDHSPNKVETLKVRVDAFV